MIDKGVSPDTVFSNTIQVIPPLLPGLAEEISYKVSSLENDKVPSTETFQKDSKDLLL